MTKEETLFQRRLLDLADTAWQRGAVLFTDFLNLNEQNVFYTVRSQLDYVNTRLFGGYDAAERKMVSFMPSGPDCYDGLHFQAEEDISFPMDCLKIEPLNKRFSDALTHRDYLGSLMNLGIDRSKIGDILVEEDCAYVFCCSGMTEYISDSLTRIRHTSVRCAAATGLVGDWKQRTEKITGSVASIRLDTLLALGFHSSRSGLTSLIEDGKVFVNGKMITGNGYHLKENDLVSVRGYGKFRFIKEVSQTKKGRIFVELEKYI